MSFADSLLPIIVDNTSLSLLEVFPSHVWECTPKSSSRYFCHLEALGHIFVHSFAGLAPILTRELEKGLKRKELWGMCILPFKNLKRFISGSVLTTINIQASDMDFYLLQTVKWLEVIFKAFKIFLWVNWLISGNWTVLWSKGDLN